MTFDYHDDDLTIDTGADVNLSEITGLVVELRKKQEDLKKLEDAAASLKAEIGRLSGDVIPELCESANVSEFVLADGTKVMIKRRFFGKVSEHNMDAAQEYLESSGNGALVKRQIAVDLGRCSLAESGRVHDALARIGVAGEEKRSIHPSTLSKFLTEQMESGADIPQEVFGVFRKVETKIK